MMLVLPPMISVDGEWEDILTRLYELFVRDFKTSKAHHRGFTVTYNSFIKPDGKGMEEGFWHVITKEYGDRTFDPRRSERLPWAKPLMQNHLAKNVKYWNYDKGSKDKGVRTFIWLQDKDYLIILQRKRDFYIWITAFYVNTPKYRADLLRQYYERV